MQVYVPAQQQETAAQKGQRYVKSFKTGMSVHSTSARNHLQVDILDCETFFLVAYITEVHLITKLKGSLFLYYRFL